MLLFRSNDKSQLRYLGSNCPDLIILNMTKQNLPLMVYLFGHLNGGLSSALCK